MHIKQNRRIQSENYQFPPVTFEFRDRWGFWWKHKTSKGAPLPGFGPHGVRCVHSAAIKFMDSERDAGLKQAIQGPWLLCQAISALFVLHEACSCVIRLHNGMACHCQPLLSWPFQEWYWREVWQSIKWNASGLLWYLHRALDGKAWNDNVHLLNYSGSRGNCKVFPNQDMGLPSLLELTLFLPWMSILGK